MMFKVLYTICNEARLGVRCLAPWWIAVGLSLNPQFHLMLFQQLSTQFGAERVKGVMVINYRTAYISLRLQPSARMDREWSTCDTPHFAASSAKVVVDEAEEMNKANLEPYHSSILLQMKLKQLLDFILDFYLFIYFFFFFFFF